MNAADRVPVKCVVPWCPVTGTGVPGRPYACDAHTDAIKKGVNTVARVAKKLAAQGLKREVKRVPWWLKTIVNGVRNGE